MDTLSLPVLVIDKKSTQLSDPAATKTPIKNFLILHIWRWREFRSEKIRPQSQLLFKQHAGQVHEICKYIPFVILNNLSYKVQKNLLMLDIVTREVLATLRYGYIEVYPQSAFDGSFITALLKNEALVKIITKITIKDKKLWC